MRDLDAKPYSTDEQRIAEWFFEKGTGGGDDPVGAMIASHEYVVSQRNELRGWLSAAGINLTTAGIALRRLGQPDVAAAIEKCADQILEQIGPTHGQSGNER